MVDLGLQGQWLVGYLAKNHLSKRARGLDDYQPTNPYEGIPYDGHTV